MTVIIVSKGKLVKTWGANAFIQAMGGGLLMDAIARYNKLNKEYKAVRV